ncbi:GNAT family N-acetyltransferase [Paludifilum halophilum]|uniref:GNAT family N-acetyltransferase n=1 Tax=Paludifilum halophilum TaxID=1642702 RepID=A0A235B5U0_9BACL|nr:GNAT family N-acetyltransferase [Paludifilum halophilum]OYD07267.1 GNAT family N-acetyltransferase [Paludifilum halophilum]
MIIRDAHITDLRVMRRIYNHVVVTSAATFDLEPQTEAQRREWFSQFNERFPLIVAEERGEVVGYCGLTPYRSKPAYTRTAELTIYVDENAQGKGVGRSLMEEILRRARRLDYHVIVAGITGENDGSVRFHQAFGFRLVGCFREVGWKFGRWQDVCFYQLILNERSPDGSDGAYFHPGEGD